MIMLTTCTISDDEIYFLLRTFEYETTKTHIVVFNHYYATSIIDMRSRTKRVLEGRGLCVTNDYVYRYTSSTSNEIEVCTLTGNRVATLPPHMEIYSVGGAQFVYDSIALYIVNPDWTIGEAVYTKKYNQMEEICKTDSHMVLRDSSFMDDNATYIVLSNGTHKILHHLEDMRDLWFRPVSTNSVIYFDEIHCNYLDLDSNVEIAVTLPATSGPIDAVLCSNEFIWKLGDSCLRADNKIYYLSSQLKWDLIQRMCFNGFTDIKMLLSLSDRQLVTFFLDQA